jgi:CCR4-NOT transcription complex subunit 6
MKLTLATWNVLADCYSKAVRKGSGSTCKNEDDFKAILNWSSRLKHINRCLTECTADIICLQEVDHYEDSFKINLVDIGYQMVYLKRPLKDDGCLIAFKSSKFSLVGTSEINLDDLVIINTGKKTGSTSRNKFAKQNVALMVQLQCLSTSQLINVCTCHIHWNPNLLDVKLAQVKYILSQLYQYRILSLLKYKLNTSHQNPHSDLSIKPIPIIFTGDFNSMPHDFIYNTVTTRFSCANDIASVSLSTEQLMASGCDLSGGGVADGASEGVPYSGSRTRFLCDATMYKLGKWMRVLGM